MASGLVTRDGGRSFERLGCSPVDAAFKALVRDRDVIGRAALDQDALQEGELVGARERFVVDDVGQLEFVPVHLDEVVDSVKRVPLALIEAGLHPLFQLVTQRPGRVHAVQQADPHAHGHHPDGPLVQRPLQPVEQWTHQPVRHALVKCPINCAGADPGAEWRRGFIAHAGNDRTRGCS